MIGVTAAIATLLGMILSGHAADRYGKGLEIVAGLILIGLGVWTLYTHLSMLHLA
jgi:putative Mn2+ efflux pump MntP